MLLFLMPDGKAESVKRVFDFLEAGLGIEVFRRLYPVILTDYAEENTMPKFLLNYFKFCY
jgi:transposase, IS30 family